MGGIPSPDVALHRRQAIECFRMLEETAITPAAKAKWGYQAVKLEVEERIWKEAAKD